MNYYFPPETKDWILVGGFCNPLTLSAMYWLFIQYKKNRPPVNNLANTRDIIIHVFCTVLVAANFVLCKGFLHYARNLNYSTLCQDYSKFHGRSREQIEQSSFFSKMKDYFSYSSKDEENDKRTAELELEAAVLLWIYMITKIIEFTDQAVAVVTGIRFSEPEVYHHIGMALMSWLGLRFLPGGSTIIWAMISSTYLSISYAVSTLKHTLPRLLSNTKWNLLIDAVIFAKYVQFGLVAFHCVTVIVTSHTSQSECSYPKLPAFILLTFLSCLILFKSPTPKPPGGGDGIIVSTANPINPQRPNQGRGSTRYRRAIAPRVLRPTPFAVIVNWELPQRINEPLVHVIT